MSAIRQPFTAGSTGATVRAELNKMLPFSITSTLTSAAAATPVHIVTDAQVPASQKVYITEILLTVNGGTAWADATGTIVKIQDTAAVAGVTFAKANLTGNVLLSKMSAGVTLAPAVLLGAGFTVAKGIDLVADHNFAAGSDIVVTVSGYIS